MDDTIENNNTSADIDIQTVFNNIQGSINELNANSQPSFQQIIKYRLPLLSAILLFCFIAFAPILFMRNNSYWMFAAVILFYIVILFAKRFYNKHKSTPLELADESLFSAICHQEMYERLINAFYQNSTEARHLLTEYSSLINQQKKQRTLNIHKLIIVSVVVTIIPIAGYSLFNKVKLWNKYSIKEVSTISKMLKPYPTENASVTDFADCLSATEEAELTFDVRPFDLKQSSPKLYYQIRINKVKLTSTGNNGCGKPEDIRIFLYDKDLNPIKSLNPYINECLEYTHKFDQEYKSFRRKGSYFYTDFVSKDSTNSEQIVRSIADSAFYYKLILL